MAMDLANFITKVNTLTWGSGYATMEIHRGRFNVAVHNIRIRLKKKKHHFTVCFNHKPCDKLKNIADVISALCISAKNPYKSYFLMNICVESHDDIVKAQCLISEASDICKRLSIIFDGRYRSLVDIATSDLWIPTEFSQKIDNIYE